MHRSLFSLFLIIEFVVACDFFQVGIFPELSGEKFEKFIALAEKLRAEYDFAHTVDAKLLPRGEPVDKPTIRLLKPFDQLFNDFEVMIML